nr:hypothetical protein GCM10020093_056160 [Planobispora longispora]
MFGGVQCANGHTGAHPGPVSAPGSPSGVTVPRQVRIGYGVGSVCTATFSTVPGLLLLFYMTNVLAIPAWIAGLVAFLPKVWDVVINPWVGQRSDRTVSRFGARRRGCWPARSSCP